MFNDEDMTSLEKAYQKVSEKERSALFNDLEWGVGKFLPSLTEFGISVRYLCRQIRQDSMSISETLNELSMSQNDNRTIYEAIRTIAAKVCKDGETYLRAALLTN